MSFAHEMTTAQVVVTTKPTPILPAVSGASRVHCILWNKGPASVFVGGDVTVTAESGLEILPGRTPLDEGFTYLGSLYAVVAKGKQSISVAVFR